MLLSFGVGCVEAKVGVNKPELLPKEFTTVIDVAGFLSDGQVIWFCLITFSLSDLVINCYINYGAVLQEKRLAQEISDIEKDTGFKLRVLAQNYPDTPGGD